jgi:thiol:disulfide interchange protein
MKKSKHLIITHRILLSRLAGVVGVIIAGVIITRVTALCSTVKAFCSASTAPTVISEQITPQYFQYSQEKLEQSLREKKVVVLYFHAPWCTSCTSFDQELLDQKTPLPENLIILKIDYDSSSSLKNQYGVIYQHTLVLLNDQGKVKEMWIGGDLASLLDYLKR